MLHRLNKSFTIAHNKQPFNKERAIFNPDVALDF